MKMITIQQLEQQKLEIEKKIAELKDEEYEWYEYKKGWEISTKQQYNGKTYSEILNSVKEKKIAGYSLIQELRNKGLNFLKDFWVFVPNPDKIEKDKGAVAGFYVDSGGACLDCGGIPGDRGAGLGVFIIRRKK